MHMRRLDDIGLREYVGGIGLYVYVARALTAFSLLLSGASGTGATLSAVLNTLTCEDVRRPSKTFEDLRRRSKTLGDI